MKMMGLTCKEVTELVGSDTLREQSWRTRLQVRLHLLMCSLCRRYAAQIRALGTQARKIMSENPPSDAQVERMKEAILQRLDVPAPDDDATPRD